MAIHPPNLRYWDWVLTLSSIKAHVNSKDWNGDTYWDTCIHVHVYCNTVSKQSPNKGTDNVMYSYVSIIWLCTCTYVQKIYTLFNYIITTVLTIIYLISMPYTPKKSLLFIFIYFNYYLFLSTEYQWWYNIVHKCASGWIE